MLSLDKINKSYRSAAQLMDLLHALNQEGLTILIVTHEHDIAERAHRTADIIVRRRDRVLSVNEGCLQYDGPRASVEVEIQNQKFERCPVELGLSDGSWAEVKKGLDKTTRVRQPEPAGAIPPPRK